MILFYETEFVLIYYAEKIWYRYELRYYEILEIGKDDKHCKNTFKNSYKITMTFLQQDF